MATEPVRIGYYDPFNAAPVINSDLQARIPLTNLHWKYDSLKPVKSIPTLPVELEEEVPKNTPPADPSVYLRLMYVTYDSLELYRLLVRPLIKEWLKNMVVPALVEWMILFVVPSGSRDKLSTLIKTSLFDKLKMDFDINGKELASLSIDGGTERCVKLRPKYENDHMKAQAYAELTAQIKDMLLSTFEARHTTYNGMLVSYKQNPTTTLTAKVRLARLFFHMRLLEDSLAIYDELYVSVSALRPTKKIALIDVFDFSVALPDFNIHTLGISNTANLDPAILLSLPTINILDLKALVFCAQTEILISLAGTSSPTQSVGYVGVMLQRLARFLNQVAQSSLVESDEWIFAVIDLFLSLDICAAVDRLLAATDDETRLQNTGFYNSRAELLLIQRTALTAIASRKGYSVSRLQDILENRFEEISLDSQPKDLDLSSSRLKSILTDSSTYYDYFEQATELIIRDLVVCGREKTIDMLSIDLALLNYQKKNYEAAIEIIHNSYQYFIQSGWNFLGGVLLEVYLHSIQAVNPDDYEKILATSLRLLATIPSGDKTVGINTYQLIKKLAQVAGLFENIVACSLHLPNVVKYPLRDYFAVNIFPHIRADQETTLDRYFLEVKVTNLLAISTTWKSVAIELDTSGTKIGFSNQNVELSAARHQTIKLYSTNFKRGYLAPSKMVVTWSENLELVEEYGPEHTENNQKDTDLDLTVLKLTNGNMSNLVQQRPQTDFNLLMYRSLDKLWCDFEPTSSLALGSNAVQFQVNNGMNIAENVTVKISCESREVRFGETSTFNADFKILERGEKTQLAVNYQYEGDSLKLVFWAHVSYYVDGKPFEYTMSSKIDRTLAVSVTVLDIFRESFFYSKFQVGTSNANFPIEIHNVSLSNSSTNYVIVSPRGNQTKIMAFGEQPVSYLYKIEPTDTFSNTKEEVFDLKVTYVDLKCSCFANLKQKLVEKFEQCGVRQIWFLFSSLLELLVFDLNHYAIYREVKMKNKDEISHEFSNMAQLHVSDEGARMKLVDSVNSVLSSLWQANSDLEMPRILSIAVPAPSLDVLHSAEFEYEKKCQYLVGEPIELDLVIDTTTRWAQEKSLEKNEFLASSSPKRGSGEKSCSNISEAYQASISPDENWLITGFKRQTFEVDSSSESAQNKFSLVLIPLNVGKIELPKIAIRLLVAEDEKSTETILKNGSETLLVVPEVESITFTF